MEKEIFNEIDRLKENMMIDLKKLIEIPSKKGEKTQDAPFGLACRDVLNQALSICKREGLEIKNIDNYIGYASYGDSDEYIGIIGHLDVVEEGEGWTYPPFSGHVEGARMYSRGALDNKGPTVAALYGILALKNLGIKPKREIRIIFGTNEETGMEDIDYYLLKEKAPIMGFTPDNKFPAIYGERGRLILEIGGDKKDLIIFINKYIFNLDNKGQVLGINCYDEIFGDLFITNKQLIEKKGQLTLKLIISLPVCDIKKIVQEIEKRAINLQVKIVKKIKYELKNPESTCVKVLNEAYNFVMNQDIKPTTTKGMTYAHKCHTIIPFGPSFPGQNGIAHLPDEWISIDDMVQCAKIYAYGIYKLNQVEEIIV